MQQWNDGWLNAARRCDSPNFDDRPAAAVIDLLVIHNISLPPGQFGKNWIDLFFSNQLPADAHPFFSEIYQQRVSSHFLISREGEMVQYVALQKRAWHAGLSEFEGRPACNDFSVGIELEGVDDIDYTDAQYQVLTQLSRAIMQACPHIRPSRIIGHSDIAPQRKTDPGAAFDWQRYLCSL
ncbi:MAG: 1,6-anhydro-N-acetylmuramyl-L-alanine amidase AmpD [gamma proteobacterium symbiont of Bathyaustriella thionipta]|nr:1,6-anhydro-N-acetylmuramyl-L-alanine amidase AmpD [gamma proteobacterium symbiont of Bathyaustriella thionipta]